MNACLLLRLHLPAQACVVEQLQSQLAGVTDTLSAAPSDVQSPLPDELPARVRHDDIDADFDLGGMRMTMASLEATEADAPVGAARDADAPFRQRL